MLICVQWILSAIGEDIVAFLEDFSEIIPPDVLSIIEDYLAYSGSQSSGLLIIGIATAIITGASAFRMLSNTLREIYESKGGNDAVRFAFSFLYAIAFLVAVYVLGITVIGGRWLINLLEPFFEITGFIKLLDANCARGVGTVFSFANFFMCFNIYVISLKTIPISHM